MYVAAGAAFYSSSASSGRSVLLSYDDLDEEYETKKKSVEIGGVKPKRLPSYGKKKEEEMPLYYNPWSILDTDSSEEEEEEEQ